MPIPAIRAVLAGQRPRSLPPLQSLILTGRHGLGTLWEYLTGTTTRQPQTGYCHDTCYLNPSIKLVSANTDVEWNEANGLIQELIEWDVGECKNLGFERADVIRTLYPDGPDDIRQHSTAPGGCFLIASSQCGSAGCAGYRPLEPETCELYNVYVRASYRGRSIGALLVKALQRTAIAAGYRTMYLGNRVLHEGRSQALLLAPV